MEIIRKQFEEALNNELIGKNVGHSYYTFVSPVLRAVRAIAKEAGLNEDDFKYRDESKNSIYLLYKGESFGRASFQKQRGEVKRYGGYEWTFKKISVNFWNEQEYFYKDLSFQEMLNKIDEELEAKETREEQKLAKAKEIFKLIQKEIGAKDIYETRAFIEYMNEHSYSIAIDK